MIYILSSGDYDIYDPTHLEGPEIEDWEGLCKSLLDEAVDLAIQLKDAERLLDHPTLVSWYDIRESMLPLLEKHGYKVVRLPEMELRYHVITERDDDKDDLLSPGAVAKLLDRSAKYNEWCEKDMEESRKKRNAAGEYLPWERPLEYRVKSGPYAGQLARFGHRLDDRIGLYLIGETEENQISVYLIDQDELEVEKCTIETTSNTTTATASGPSDSA